MTECYQDFVISFDGNSKESRDDFIKFYLDNFDQFSNENFDGTNYFSSPTDAKKPFSIVDYKHFSTDHNASFGLVKPQFSFVYRSIDLSVMIDLRQSMLWTSADGDVKLEKGVELMKEVLARVAANFETIDNHSDNNNNDNRYRNCHCPSRMAIVNVFCFGDDWRMTKAIVKGWQLRRDNLDAFVRAIVPEIYASIDQLCCQTPSDWSQRDDFFFNVVREGIVSLNLRQTADCHSCSSLLLVTDANFSIPDGLFLDKLVALLRFCSISCSFVHVRTDSHLSRFSSVTDQANEDQLRLLANVSGGSYSTSSRDLASQHSPPLVSQRFFDQSDCSQLDSVTLKHFHETVVNAPPLNVILTLVNAGYFLSSVAICRDSRYEIELQLPWRSGVFVRASIVTRFPMDQLKRCVVTLSVVANSYFLHCLSGRSGAAHNDQSLHDGGNVQRFSVLYQETRTLIHLLAFYSQFHHGGSAICTVPSIVNNGLKPIFSLTNQQCEKIPRQFVEFWKRTLELEYLACAHSTKILLLLEHDFPFPDFLGGPDPVGGRCSTIQCREALVQLSTLISKNFCSFIVKENSTYVKLFPSGSAADQSSHFCVIRMSPVLHDFQLKLVVHFFIYTPERIRDEFVSSLRTAIGSLRFPPRGKQARPRHMSSQTIKKRAHVPPQQRSWEQINCCNVLTVDLDNLFAGYNPIKSIDPNNQPSVIVRQNKSSLAMHYLHNQCHHEHQYWLISDTFKRNIFETLIKVRLQEGFHFASSDSATGFVNLLKEIQLTGNQGHVQHSFIQYLIYFDRTQSRNTSEIDHLSWTTDDVMYLVGDKFVSWKLTTEIFIERKNGLVTNCEPEVNHWNNLRTDQIPKQITDIDQKSIETFVTFECFQIYPAMLPKHLVKPNICSVLANSSRFLLLCPLYSCDSNLPNFQSLNSVFLEIFDRNLKLHGFKQIDITKTENANFNLLLKTTCDDFPDTKNWPSIVWHCYYSMAEDNLIVLMLPSNYLDADIDPEMRKNLPVFVYGMSLKHLSFLIEDRWTLKLPENRIRQLPININNPNTHNNSGDNASSQTNRNPSNIHIKISGKSKSIDLKFEETPDVVDKNNEFAVEIERIQMFLRDSVKKLDSIYVLTFVAGVHKNLRENRVLTRANLSTVFHDYCCELSYYDVDATKFMNTICGHCFNALQSNIAHSNQSLSLICKDNCEAKTGMHNRIVKRIRQMMAKYFKEVPSFPEILIYCPENESEILAEFTESVENELSNLNEESNNTFAVFQRQSSQDYQLVDLETITNCADNISDLDAKSISSIALSNQNNCCPLFIMINYTLKYIDEQKYLNFDTIPTCISDFIEEVKSITNDDIDFHKLRFHLDMIPITVIDEDLNDDVIKSKNDNYSLIVDGQTSIRRKHSEITKKYLSTFQTQLLTNCRNELVWTLDDEIVNCLKYLTPIDRNTIELVMKHIDNSAQQKWFKSYSVPIRKKLYDLEFVFGFEKSKNLFQERFERSSFGKNDQYKLEKIGTVYCVFQKIKFIDDHSALGLGMFPPDQNMCDIDEVFMQSRIRYDTMCYGSLNRTIDNDNDRPIKRSSSDGKLNYRNYSRKMSSEPQERQSLFPFNLEKANGTNITDSIKPVEFRPITNIIAQTNPFTITRQSRSPMPYLLNHHTVTPKRHRSGEANSTIYTGNYRSDTPMLNDLISTATSSKGYEGDSSRISDTEDMEMIDHFSNSAVDNKIEEIKSEMAPFWMLLNIIDQQKQIEVYFHHTDNCYLSCPNDNFTLCEHCNSFKLLFDKINGCVHQVNQCLLLDKLAQTRVCRDILVPDDYNDQKNSSMSQYLDYEYDDESIDLSKKFKPGAFECPKVLKITFRLHYRLRGVTDKNSKAIPLLRSSLENIAVINRKDMLIFVDDETKGIFYSIMREISVPLDQDDVDRLNESSVLISSSSNQLSKTVKIEEIIQQKSENLDNLSIKSAPTVSDNKSLSRSFQTTIGSYRNVELLELSIYGVDKLSGSTISSITSNIGSKLDMIVLRKLSESICRSRAITLNKEDIDFLLSDDFHNKPQKPKSFSWILPKLAVDNKLAFCYYLKQNLQLAFISPKICDPRLSERLYFNSEHIGEVYIYNQTSAQGISHEVIALFTLQFLDTFTKSSCIIKESSLPDFQSIDEQSMINILDNNRVTDIENGCNNIEEFNTCYLNFNLWIRGLVDVEIIKKKILSAIQYSLNDLFMEYIIIPCPISLMEEDLVTEVQSESFRLDKAGEFDSRITSFDNGSIGNLNKLFADNLCIWVPKLCKIDLPLLKHRCVEMYSDLNVEFLVYDLVESMSDFLQLKVFHYENNAWCPWNTQNPKSGTEYPGMIRSFIAIGRLDELWKRFVIKKYATQMDMEDFSLTNSQTSLSFSGNPVGSSLNSSQTNIIKELRKIRTLLKQPPLDNSLLTSSNQSSTTLFNSNNLCVGMPEFCNVRVSSSTIIPRQMLCIIKVHGRKIEVMTYNLAKEVSDHLTNAMDNVLKNNKARFQMMTSFIYQKLGLFYECSSKSCLPLTNVNTVKSYLYNAQPMKVKSNNPTVGEINRERKSSGTPRSFSPSGQFTTKGYTQSRSSSKNITNKQLSININLSRMYQDAYTICNLSEIKKSDNVSDIIQQYAIQFLNTYQLEYKRRILSKKIRQSISYLQPNSTFKQSELTDMDCPLQQLDVFSSLKRACRIFHSVVCPILLIPNVRKKFLNALAKKPPDKEETPADDSSEEWIHEIGRIILAHYADYVQKEHGFQFLNPPRPNMSLNPGSHALFQKLSNNSGIHIIEVFVLKDCLCVRLNLLEIRRLNSTIPGFTSLQSGFQHLQNFQKSFVKDACKYCDLTHLVSFMYDIYVRMIANSILYPEENKKTLNPILFLRDLVKLYAQPPLYSTSHIYLMPFPVSNDVIKPDDLFEFLQRHYDDYNFLVNNFFSNQITHDSSTSFLYNVFLERFHAQIINNEKISPSSSSPLDMTVSEEGVYYKYLDSTNECDLTSIFCLTRSQQNPNSSFDLFIITLNTSNIFPHQKLIPIGNNDQKSSTFLASYLTILPHHSEDPANLLHLNPCPITLTRIDTNSIPQSIAWRTYNNRSIVPLQAPLFLTLKTLIDNYFKESNEKFLKATTDCHKDSLWHRMYQRSEIVDSTKFSLTFEEFQDLINSGDVVDILELDKRLIDSMKIAASHLKELNEFMGILSDDCYTVLYENTTSIYEPTNTIVSSHLVLMSNKTKDGFLLLSKNQEPNTNPDNYIVQLKAIFRSQDCRNRMPPQQKYFSSSLRDITVMLAETAAFCIWKSIAFKPLTVPK